MNCNKVIEISNHIAAYISQKADGSFTFQSGDKLNKLIEKHKDLNNYGVYRFRANTEDGEILYIGHSGTASSCKFKKQKLSKRIMLKQEGRCRQEFFEEQIKKTENKLTSIIIEWFIIKEDEILPAYVKALLIQEFWKENKRLPKWNKTF